MSKDSLTMESRKSRISLASTVTSVDVDNLKGRQFNKQLEYKQQQEKLVWVEVRVVFGELNIVDTGIGYTGISTTYTNVSLQSITGSGINATANITINNGGIVASATIVNGGSGYAKGDILEPVSIGSQNLELNEIECFSSQFKESNWLLIIFKEVLLLVEEIQ